MTKQPSWQKRQVDSFGKFRIEYGSPTNQMTGQRVYTLMAEGTGGNSKLGMRDNGNYDIQVDQTITISGATKGTPPRDGNGVVITSVEGGISITCQKGKLSLVAEEIELVSGKDIWCSALGGQMVVNSKKCHFKVKDLDVDMGMFRGNNIPGDVVVRDAGFLASVCAGTEVNYQQ